MNIKIVCRESKARKNGESPLELSIVINGKRAIIALDRKCKASSFNPSTQKVRGDKALNDYISAITTKCWKLNTQMLNEGMDITVDTFIDAFKNGITKNIITIYQVFEETIKLYATKLKNGQISSTTLGKYKTTYEHFKQFSDNCDITTITANTCNNFYDHLCTKMKNNSAVQKMKCFKTVIQYAIDEGYIQTNPFKTKLHIDKLEYNPLSLVQVQALKDKQITIERLSKVRDLFVFQCYTGLAYTDMATLTRDNIKDGMIIKHRNKTSVKSIIPILDTTKEILEKYDYQLPLLSNQKYNCYLKELGTICGIEQELHSHLARHTCATIFLNNGCDINTVAKVLGHSSTRITEATYAELLPSTVQKQVLQLNNIM